jgi:hypothetical protein
VTAIAEQHRVSDGTRPPFPLERPTSASWREQALSKIAELRFVRDWLLDAAGRSSAIDELRRGSRATIERTIDDHLQTAAIAAKGGSLWKPRNLLASLTGSMVERVNSQLDAVEGELLRVAPSDYLVGEVPSLLAHVQLHLAPDDPRRLRLEAIAERVIRGDEDLLQAGGQPGGSQNGRHESDLLSESDRQAVISAVRAASAESRWKVSRLRSFRNVIVVSSLVMTLAAIGTIVFAFRRPSALPICFTPANVVCTTSTTFVPRPARENASGQQSAASQAATDKLMRGVASGWDVAVVELVGLIAAALAAAAALRNVQGTSTPYSLPVALAVLKLPTGALTALLGLLLMRGGFVPGLSALDSSAQIIAWALVFGYAQQLLTRLVDSRAQTVLEGAGGDTKSLAAPPALAQHGATSGSAPATG